MDVGVLKDPAELLASKIKAFKNCLQLATECLSHKDYINAEMIYGGILADLHKEYINETLNLNDLEVFSLHTCFAYSSIGSDSKSEQALVLLNSLNTGITLPLVPYLKAFVHISNDRLSFAHDELRCCQTLLDDGYNFKFNSVLNPDIIPEVNDDFLKIKLNGLTVACNLLKSNNCEKWRDNFRENWLQLGKLCETDFTKTPEAETAKAGDKKKAKKGNQMAEKAQKSKTVGVQVAPLKGVSVGVQTAANKEVNKELFAAVMEIKTKMNNLQSKKEAEMKLLQKKNTELNEKLVARDGKRQEKMTEFEFLKDQYAALEKKYEQSQKHNEILQKLLVEQLQHKYNIQKNIYQLFEEKCDYKIEYLIDAQKYLESNDRPTPEECKQEVTMWQNTLNKINGAKRDFELYYKSIDDLLLAKKYSTIKTTEWPNIPFIPNDMQDLIYRNFKVALQQSKNQVNGACGSGHHWENPHKPNYNGYNSAFKEDGRTTGSPSPFYKFQNNNQPSKPFAPYFRPYPGPSKPYDGIPFKERPEYNIFKTDADMLRFLQAYFKGENESELVEASIKVRENTGGNILEMPKKLLIEEMKKVMRGTLPKSHWNIASSVQWQNDHSDNKCCICFEDYDEATSHSLKCQHEFHKKCIANWLKRQNACPVCREHAVMDEEFPPLKN